MIYHRKAETVRAIQITDCSPATVARVKEFTGGRVRNGLFEFREDMPYLSVVVDNHYFRVLEGKWLVHSPEKGWRVYRHSEFEKEYEEGEHGQQSVDGTVEGL
ncbi:hypothetical protein PAXY110619_12395 [Paenibacillus xylanexedens]|uniref:Uncharacterized protein n=1 Tax=Paenibacillus xylanexedens TaxID=528191 RepID=A0ABS4RN85_PAEXY|nr:hypothetical protein [Paenibacillus xylanexedens]